MQGFGIPTRPFFLQTGGVPSPAPCTVSCECTMWVSNQRMSDAFRDFIFEKEILCILYFITGTDIYKLSKLDHAAACFQVHVEQ